jgi:hypothetical protein
MKIFCSKDFGVKRQSTNAMVDHKTRASLAHKYGRSSFEMLKLVLYHILGELPGSPFLHKLC